ncbi:hypothetical protein F3Y22_tig00110610pilonHSYRG00387 [Hibiscus syriacus]|uniref:MULE transposase domain-containing protein n=1 Tax=Hibiscus syriacus TaxID=106335 RepID=A0A6A3A0G7_HIBSY|nr:hypothetical protein F3Y22_tig00110610pilonHSYRG00387 [Hibiscus syriacus]
MSIRIVKPLLLIVNAFPPTVAVVVTDMEGSENAGSGPVGIDGLVDEESNDLSYDTQDESGELCGYCPLIDDDDEINSIRNNFKLMKRKIKNSTVTISDLEVVNKGVGEVNEDSGNVDLGATDHDEEGTGLGSAKVNEANLLGGENSEEDIVYMHSSDVGSYETDSNGDFVSKDWTADPDGAFDLVVVRPTPVENPKFRRLYVCFGALKECFKKYCRVVIGIDGCFLKGAFQGDGENVTLLSDMQKGLLEELPLWLPNVEYRFCARHIYANWKKRHNGGDLQLLFWACCKAISETIFEHNVNRIENLASRSIKQVFEGKWKLSLKSSTFEGKAGISFDDSGEVLSSFVDIVGLFIGLLFRVWGYEIDSFCRMGDVVQNLEELRIEDEKEALVVNVNEGDTGLS